jgi:membrane protease YdiL (CAAX protease family)
MSGPVHESLSEPPPPTTRLRMPQPDVPPPPPGTWPLAEARLAPPLRPHGPASASVVPAAGLGLSSAAIVLYLVGQFGLQLLAASVLIGTGLLDPATLDPSEPGPVLLGFVVASQLAGLVAVLVLLRVRSVPLRPLVGPLRPLGRHLGTGAGLGLAAIVGSSIVVTLLVTLSGSEATPDQVLTGGIAETPLQLALAVLAAVVLAPLAEELIFRGLLHRSLRARMRIVPATIISSVLFAIVHVDVALSQPLALVGLTLVGAVMAVAYERTGSLLVPVTIHAVHNAITVLAVVVTSRFDLDTFASAATLLGRAVPW